MTHSNERNTNVILLAFAGATFSIFVLARQLMRDSESTVGAVWIGTLLLLMTPVAVWLGIVQPLHSVYRHVYFRRVRMWHILWTLFFLSGLVFRTRMINEIQQSQVDAWAIYRMSLVGVVTIVLLVKLVLREDFRKTLRTGILIPLVAYSCFCLASTVWSIYPSWTAYHAAEFGTVVLLIAATVSDMRSIEDADEVLDFAFKLLTVLIASIWVGLLFAPQEALKASHGLIPFQLFGVVPFFETNIVGEYSALLLVISAARCATLGRHRSSAFVNASGMVLGSITLLLSQTRSAILAGFVGIGVTLLIARRRLGIVAATVCLLAYFSGGANLVHDFMMRGENEQVVEGLNGRVDFWAAGMQAVSAHPLTGLGAYAGGRFGILPQFGFDAVTMHSTCMEVLVDTGFTGLVPILCLIIGMWWILVRHRPGEPLRSSEQRLTAIAVFSMLTVRSFFDAEFIENSTIIFFALIAYTEYLRRTHVRVPVVCTEPAEKQSRRSGFAQALTAIVFAYLGITATAPRLSTQILEPYSAQTFGLQLGNLNATVLEVKVDRLQSGFVQSVASQQVKELTDGC